MIKVEVQMTEILEYRGHIRNWRALCAELGIPADTDYRAIADSTQLTGGCPRKFDAEELYQILLECR